MTKFFQTILWCLIAGMTFVNVYAQQASQVPKPEKQYTPYVMNPEAECTGSGELIYDDGVFENGYGWNPTVSDGRFVSLFTPLNYPWQFNTFCLSLTRVATSPADFTFDIVVYDGNGGGVPGTLVATISGVTATAIPIYPSFAFYDYDVSSIPQLASGSYYIGIKYDPSIVAAPHYSAADESPTTALHPGYAYDGTSWSTIQTLFTAYRALGYRTLGSGGSGPGPATDPMPADGATDVDINQDISWTNPGGETSVEVFWGTDPGSLTSVYSGAPISSFDPGTLDYLTDYYWKIAETDGAGTTNGPTWHFTTMQDPSIVTLYLDDFESGTGNWTITTANGCPWDVIPISSRPYTLPATAQGNAFASDADLCGSSGGGSSSTAILNNPIDATGYSGVAVEWDNDWQAINSADFAYVDVSVDGGATWMNVVTFDVNDVRNTHEFYNISSMVANQSFMLRLVSVQPAWDWWWAIDNLQVTGWGASGTYFFSDNFDSYTAGDQLACQNPADWTTWNLTPCDAVTDAYISSNFSHSAPNSFVVVADNDEVHYWGPETSGLWEVGFYNYIPTGKTGYFNTLSQFVAAQEWGLEVYFNPSGAAAINAGGNNAATFTYSYDTWVFNQVIVDLDNDLAQYWYNGTMIYQWQWTLGASGTPIALSIAANDFYGNAATDEMYVDDYYVNFVVPVEFTTFNADVNNGTVVLNWSTATETNNQGFEVQRNSGNGFEALAFIQGNGTSTQSHSYSFTDNTVRDGKYSYRLKQVDFDGTSSYSNTVDVDIAMPKVYSLSQNYPNPFNPSTQINFSLAADSKVTLKIFDILGQEVATLLNGNLVAGAHTANFDASRLTSGVYLYRIDAAGVDGSKFTSVKKMILTK